MKSTLAFALLPLLTAAATSAAWAGPAACPQAAEQLPELLASAMQRIGAEGQVRAEFAVDAQGRVQPITVDGNRRYRGQVRTALYSLDCSGTAPQRYVLNIRFADPAPASAAASMAKAPAALIAISESRHP